MLPVTPTRDWNIIPNRRSVISPDESDQGNNNNHNNNNNPSVLLDDSDSDNDESTSSFPSNLTLISQAETSTPSFEIDIGATDHIDRPTKRFAVDISEYFLHGALTDRAQLDQFLVAPSPIENNDDDTTSTSSTSLLSYCSSMGQDVPPSIDDYLRKEY
jgi:hypothetical protein